MTIDEIIKHVMENPENTNPAVLRDQLTQLVGNNVEGAPSTDSSALPDDLTILNIKVTSENTAFFQVDDESESTM